jgi:hypothetical protein
MYRGMYRSLAQTRNSCHQLPERAETLSYTYTANPRGLARFDLRGVEGVEHRIALPALARTYARPLRVIRIAGPILSSSHTSWNQRRIRVLPHLASLVVEPTPLANLLSMRSLLGSFTTLQTQGDCNNGLSCNSWASFEGFEGGERFQAGLPLSPSGGGRAVTTSFGHSVRRKMVDRRYVSP